MEFDLDIMIIQKIFISSKNQTQIFSNDSVNPINHLNSITWFQIFQI